MAQPLMMCFRIRHPRQLILELTVGAGPIIVAKNSKMVPDDPNGAGLDTYVIGDSFGFEDGISQPLMNGIDELDANAAVNMNTDPRLLIVTADTWSEEDTVERPTWMYDGSFLVFRKLEQNVRGFEALVAQW